MELHAEIEELMATIADLNTPDHIADRARQRIESLRELQG